MSVRVGGAPRRRNGVSVKTLLGCVVCTCIVVASTVLSARPPVAEARVEKVVVGSFDTVRVPVPAKTVPLGTKVRDIPLQFIEYPKHQLPTHALLTLENYAEAVTIAALPASLPIFGENLSHEAGSTNPVIERIPEGMRAMTLRVDATAAVEGWAGSGSIVDVLLVLESKTTVVAEKVKILSAERSVAPVEGSMAPSVPTTVTLLVTQEQCLAINTAIPRGRIAFALRATRDDGSWRSTSFSADRLQGGPEAKTADIRGVATVIGKAFALSDGKWVPATGIPAGFLATRED